MARRKLEAETSQAEADQLRSLKEHPGWAIFEKLARKARTQALNDALLKESGDFEKGFFEGIVRALVIIDWSIADSIDDLERRTAAMPNELLTDEDVQGVRP